MTKHTQGPWSVEGGPVEWSVLAPNPDAGLDGVSYGGRFLAVVHGVDDLANARLIAAAPELLDALQTMVREFSCGRTPLARDISAARAAIAKAGG